MNNLYHNLLKTTEYTNHFFSCEMTAAHYSGDELTITEPWCTTGHIRLPPQNICHMVPQLNRRVIENNEQKDKKREKK
jgi:hypothetical protein